MGCAGANENKEKLVYTKLLRKRHRRRRRSRSPRSRRSKAAASGAHEVFCDCIAFILIYFGIKKQSKKKQKKK